MTKKHLGHHYLQFKVAQPSIHVLCYGKCIVAQCVLLDSVHIICHAKFRSLNKYAHYKTIELSLIKVKVAKDKQIGTFSHYNRQKYENKN